MTVKLHIIFLSSDLNSFLCCLVVVRSAYIRIEKIVVRVGISLVSIELIL